MTPGHLALLVALGHAAADPPAVAPPPVAEVGSPDLRIGSAVVLVLLDGQRLDGTFAGFEGRAVRLSGSRGVAPIPLALVSAVEVEGRTWSREAFLDGARRAAEALPPLAVPPPALPLAASFAWAGTGHLLLGDTRTFLGYAAFDAILVGSGAVFALQRQWGALAPVVVLDVLLRGWSGGASAREAARRRALRRVQEAQPGAEAPPQGDPQPPAGLDR